MRLPFIRKLSCVHMLLACTFAAILAAGVGIAENELEQTRLRNENKLKAVYLFNFLQFSEWPDSCFKTEDAPLVFTILGIDPFGSILDQTMESEKIGTHPIVIHRLQNSAPLENSHAVFVCSSEGERLGQILKSVDAMPVLTISDVSRFAARGGCIGFIIEENKLKFQVNTKVVDRSGLRMSSKLLRLAKIVDSL